MQKSSVILLSGGLDSIANFYIALKENKKLRLAITFDYGQKANLRELAVARWHAKKARVPYKIIKTKMFKTHGESSLLNDKNKIPTGPGVKINNKKKSEETAKSVWVPNRNGVFLNIAAFYAESLSASEVIIGFNQEEAQTFPDNSEGFLNSANQFFSYSTQNKVKVASSTLKLTKSEIIKKHSHLLPLEKLWPCYQNFDFWCGECESCLRYRRALDSQNINWEVLLAKNEAFIKSL